ncbi:hypothetical protein [Breoghania sp.]|uniref:hypothetical protein n=1 Tax=Breoghania sp. TaxID=2065378 RepID=UPI0026134B8A|nr:hypothetical protein [Breoghania sp.]
MSAERLNLLRESELAELSARFAPGAVLVAAEPAPSLVLDMIFGIGEEWWSQTASPVFPISRLRLLDEWRETLKSIGFAKTDGAALSSGDTDAFLLLAQTRSAPTQTQDARTTADPDKTTAKTVLIVHDSEDPSHDIACALAGTMERTGHTVSLIADSAEVPQTLAEIANADTEVVHLAGAFSRSACDNSRVRARMDGFVDLLKALHGRETGLWIVSPDAMQSVTGHRQHDPAQAAI